MQVHLFLLFFFFFGIFPFCCSTGIVIFLKYFYILYKTKEYIVGGGRHDGF